ncbi:DnaB-like helicase C-terminal domain-containing protein [Streptomyces sp. NBC_01367]|uniref:DnaB-like helicase C-terminal domain-containing protein n=1 Tax=Streptomyces sp. NBC_01367 TaxID=2903841 RepID=UPI0032561065
MSDGIKRDSSAPATMQHQLIGKVLNGDNLPTPRQLATLIGWLSREGSPHVKEADYSSHLVEELLRLRADAENQSAHPKRTDKSQDALHTASADHSEEDRVASIFANQHSESQALAGMLSSSDATTDAAGILRVDDFTKEEHRIIFTAILAAHKREENYTLEDVRNICESSEWPAKDSAEAFLRELHERLEDRRQTELHAEIVGERALLRRIFTTGQRISQWAQSAAESKDPEIESLLEAIYREVEHLNPAPSSYNRAATGSEKNQEEDDVWPARTIPSGFRDLDALTSGFRGGCLTVIAGASNMGKTTLAADLARTCSIANGRASLFISLQMTRDDISMRLLSAEARVALHAMQAGQLSDSDWARLDNRLSAVSDAPLYIMDSPQFSIRELKLTCKRLRRERDLHFVVIDSIDLLIQPEAIEVSRSAEVQKLANSLRLLARELNIPIVGLYQLGRLPEGRWSSTRPTLRDLPAEIENLADLVILLHREDAYENESPRAGEADFIVAKNRHGRTGVAVTAFQGHYARFVDMQQT